MTLIDVQLGIVNKAVASASGRAVLVAGYSTSGPAQLPTLVASLDALTTTFGTGAAVEEAAFVINAGRPVLFWRDDTAALAYGAAPLTTGGGTSVASYDATQKPADRCHFSVVITAAGTVGTAGVKYRTARNVNAVFPDDFGVEQSLGTATFIQSPEGIKINLTVGTVLLNQRIDAEGILPKMSTAKIDAALQSLKGLQTRVDLAYFASEVGATEIAQLTASLDTLKNFGLQPVPIAPLAAALRTDVTATWLAAVQAAVQASTDWRICVAAPEEPAVSLVSGRPKRLSSVTTSIVDKACRLRMAADLRSPVSPAVSPDSQTQRPDDTAGPTIQSLSDAPVLSPYNWDERQSGALDANRICALNRIPGFTGTYIGSAPVLSLPGTAIRYLQDARVAAFTFEELRRALIGYAGRVYDTLPDEGPGKPAGRLAPYERTYIEENVGTYMRALLGITPGASGAAKSAVAFTVTLDPTDSIADEKLAAQWSVTLLGTLAVFSGSIVVSK